LIQDLEPGLSVMFRIRVKDQFQKKDSGSGSGFRVKIQGQDLGSGFLIRIKGNI